MQIDLERYNFQQNRTFGKLYLNGEFLCDTLEDRYRNLEIEEKVSGTTAIPFGKYRVKLTYSPHFKRILPQLMNVPYFEGVRIHSGNTEKDTSGCILVGIRRDNVLVDSRKMFNKFMERISKEILMYISIYDSRINY